MSELPSPATSPGARRAGAVTLTAGLLVVGLTSITGAAVPLAALGFAAWAAAPYAALWAVSRVAGTAWIIGGAGLAALVFEIAVRLTVFVVPRGSTAAVALVFSPVVIGLVAMPVGAACGWLAGRLWTRGVVGRVAVAVSTVAMAVWTIVGVAWPEQLPTARLARQRALDAIGAPRVVAGGDRWTSRAIPGATAWPAAIDVDGDGNEALATVAGGTIEIRRLPTLDVVARHTLAQPSSWSWYSRLARLPDGLAVVATGGGFQETRVTSLDGSERWTYRPDATLPPTSLVAADLDADGVTEFYATINAAIVRLDAAGRETWRRDIPSPYPLGTLPPSDRGPGLVAAAEYRGAVRVWRADGTAAGSLPWPADAQPLRLADWTDGRVLLSVATGCSGTPGCGARADGLDGRTRWRIDAPAHMRPMDIVTLRPRPGQPPLRVLVASASTDVERARLQVIDAEGRVDYDEVLASTPRLTVVRTKAGDQLLVQVDDRLSLLAPR
ncbi:MAG: hypothetical protein U0P30_18300 [Vicinamibacterales bacterium]